MGTSSEADEYNGDRNDATKFYDGKIGLSGYWSFQMSASDVESLYETTKKFYQARERAFLV